MSGNNPDSRPPSEPEKHRFSEFTPSSRTPRTSRTSRSLNPNTPQAPSSKRPQKDPLLEPFHKRFLPKEARGLTLDDLPLAKLATGVGATLGLIGIVALGITAARSCSWPQSSAPTVKLVPPPTNLAPEAKVSPENPRPKRERWAQAIEDPTDVIELQRLADEEGAAGLLEALEEGGGIGVVALAALPYAEDAELAFRRLAEIAKQVDDTSLPLVLDSMQGIAQQPRHQRERYDAMGVHMAFDAMVEISKRPKLSPTLRARAVTVGRLLCELGPYDRNMLPTDFDDK